MSETSTITFRFDTARIEVVLRVVSFVVVAQPTQSTVSALFDDTHVTFDSAYYIFG